ncbi:MAG: LptF/LptG family permease [Bacteroidia bacterium]|nr:LptF/LptG family permease [Bacteroidia bacterium]
MLKKIDKHILRSYIGPWLMAFGIIMFILVLFTVYPYLREVLGKGIGPGMLGKLIFYASGKVALLAMPIGILTGALMTYGGLGENNELAAMKSSGVSLVKISRSTVLLSVLIAIWALWFSYEIVPRANLKFYSLFYDMQRKKADVALGKGEFYDEIPDYSIYVSDKNNKTGTLYRVRIYNHLDDKNGNNHARDKGNTDITIADSAYMFMEGLTMKMVLYNGSRYEEVKPEANKMDNSPFARTYFDSLVYAIDLTGKGFEFDRTDEKQFRHQIIMRQAELVTALDSLERIKARNRVKNYNQIGRYTKIDTGFFKIARDTAKEKKAFILESTDIEDKEEIMQCFPNLKPSSVYKRALANARSVKSMLELAERRRKQQSRNVNRYTYEFNQRHALPVNCIVFMLLGISLGAIIRRGGFGIPAIVSIIMFVAFYILYVYGYRLAKENAIAGWLGAWLPIIVFGPIALYTTIQATMETSLFNESFWQSLRERIFYAQPKSPPKKDLGE